MEVSKYKIYCLTEAQYVEGWSVDPPEACYNNNTHSVNSNSVQIIQTVKSNEVKIKEDSIPIPRNVWINNIEFTDVASQTSQNKYFTFDIPTSMYSFTLVSDDTNKNDEVSIAINPDTPLGLITQPMLAGATSFYAPPALLLYGWNGFWLTITEGDNTDELGRILSINKETGVVTVTNAAQHSYSTAALIKMTFYTMKDVKLTPGVLKFGDDVIGGASAPVGTVVRFTYRNNTIPGDLTDAPKSFIIYMTLLF